LFSLKCRQRERKKGDVGAYDRLTPPPQAGRASTSQTDWNKMPARTKTRIDAALARVCLHCPVCKQARRRQRGAAFWFVTKIERGTCPFCRAYERVHGRKAHEPA
jgi:hypothetical protein